jgi:hypothetical protein
MEERAINPKTELALTEPTESAENAEKGKRDSPQSHRAHRERLFAPSRKPGLTKRFLRGEETKRMAFRSLTETGLAMWRRFQTGRIVFSLDPGYFSGGVSFVDGTSTEETVFLGVLRVSAVNELLFSSLGTL